MRIVYGCLVFALLNGNAFSNENNLLSNTLDRLDNNSQEYELVMYSNIGQNFKATKLPASLLSGTNFELRIVPNRPSTSLQYRLLTRFIPRVPDSPADLGEWTPQADWGNDGRYILRGARAGALAVHVQIRSTKEQSLLIDKHLGVITILDAIEMRLSDTIFWRFRYSDTSLIVPPQIIDKLKSTEYFDQFALIVKEEIPPIVNSFSATQIEARIIWYWQVVTSLWNYGNREKVRSRGCSRKNEKNFYTDGLFTFKSFVSDETGCCTDYVALLVALLQRDGVKASVIALDEHFLIEASFNGKKWLLDPTAGLLFTSSLHNIQETDLPVAAFILQTRASDLSIDDYRHALGQLRQYLLTKAAMTKFFEAKYSDARELGNRYNLVLPITD